MPRRGGGGEKKVTMDKNEDVRLTARTHKLSFDEYTGRFFFESKIEGIARNCLTRLKHTDAMNKGEGVIMSGQHRQLEGKRHIFEMKHVSESDALKLSLQDFTAHRKALEDVCRHNDADPRRNTNLGSYGLNSSRRDLIDLIELEKLRMDPEWRRKKQCQILLRQRKPMDVIERDMSTSRLMLSWRRKSRADDNWPKVTIGGDKGGKLILPLLKVSMSFKKGLAKSIIGDLRDDTQKDVPDPETTSLPPVFITHMSKTGSMPT